MLHAALNFVAMYLQGAFRISITILQNRKGMLPGLMGACGGPRGTGATPPSAASSPASVIENLRLQEMGKGSGP